MHVLLVYECNFLFHLLGRVLLKEDLACTGRFQ